MMFDHSDMRRAKVGGSSGLIDSLVPASLRSGAPEAHTRKGSPPGGSVCGSCQGSDVGDEDGCDASDIVSFRGLEEMNMRSLEAARDCSLRTNIIGPTMEETPYRSVKVSDVELVRGGCLGTAGLDRPRKTIPQSSPTVFWCVTMETAALSRLEKARFSGRSSAERQEKESKVAV
jgi:hypothetical protein